MSNKIPSLKQIFTMRTYIKEYWSVKETALELGLSENVVRLYTKAERQVIYQLNKSTKTSPKSKTSLKLKDLVEIEDKLLEA